MRSNAARDNYIRSNHQTRLHEGYGSFDNVEGTAARKPENVKIQRPRLKSSAEVLKRSKALKRQKAIFAVSGTMIAIVLAGLCTLLLTAMSTGNSLKKDVSEKEAVVEALTLDNDSREYEINSSVDLNEIINAATLELGMVRSNVSQIVTYSIKNSEYLQQVAQVPAK